MFIALDRLRGSIGPLVTPFRNGELDADAYARLISCQIENGTHGVMVNGTTSEPATLGYHFSF
jgi:4-hydroxy-tetrahydrodipicolinate synthase